MYIVNNVEQKSNKIKSEKFKNMFFVFLFIGLVGVDQLTKYFSHNVFKNYQFAFSLPLPIWLIYSIYVIVLATMVIYSVRHYKYFTKQQTIAWVLIFAGALSNIGERMTLGYVSDWIYILTGVFNLADFYILAGILILLIKQDSKQINKSTSV